jgi:hypothetical protein
LAGTVRSAYAAAPSGGEVGGPNPAQEIKLNRYVIEREVPGIGGSSAKQLCDIAQTSDTALAKLAPHIQGEHS